MLELFDLTPEQYQYFKQNIYNGVGSREFPIDPPDFIFETAALEHDFAYWRGGPEELRTISDKKFLNTCLLLSHLQPKWKWPFYIFISYVYYFVLKLLGKYAWEYYNEPAETWEEFLDHYQKYQNKSKITKNLGRFILKQIR